MQCVFAAGHTLGITSSESNGPAADAAIAAMRSAAFDLMGTPRTYWDLYLGFGLLFTVFMVVSAAVSFQLGSEGWSDATRRRLAWTQVVMQALVTLLCFTHFFLGPRAMSAATTIVLGLAAIASSRQQGSLTTAAIDAT